MKHWRNRWIALPNATFDRLRTQSDRKDVEMRNGRGIRKRIHKNKRLEPLRSAGRLTSYATIPYHRCTIVQFIQRCSFSHFYSLSNEYFNFRYFLYRWFGRSLFSFFASFHVSLRFVMILLFTIFRLPPDW